MCQALFAGGIPRCNTWVKMQADDPSAVRIDGPSSADPRLRVTSLAPGRQLVTVRRTSPADHDARSFRRG
ncbi:MAG: hypothetical protein U0892_21370 [Pirellulales bacterium]